ncbi:peptide ABC transporter substrate-binding protein [Paenibacillus taiwanensis]|uniref:peptide ABC transporter substrate-binding protein n=1 Tax=Paenibacillus taiwanensis TaxID=401638 RepID=UPI00040F3AEE|nr:peptide ABC transporter substrate-binding protein [Paenibacillus taiwanensis]
MKKKSMLLVLTLLLAVSAFVSACGGSSTPAKEEAKNEQKSNENKNEPAKEQVFRFNSISEPPSLDPGQAQDSTSFALLGAVFEGLTRSDENGKPLEGTAEKWEISPDGTKYTFHLRKDAKWSNGDPVTANDFEFAWKRVLDPDFQPAPPYAYQLYYIKNAEGYNKHKDAAYTKTKITDPNEVGVKALDANTLEVQLESPTAYFLSLLSFQTFFPVHQSVKSNPKWASDANSIISNGPFKVSKWVKQSSLELAKNDNYYAKDEVKFTKVQVSIVSEGSSELNMYETNVLDYSGMPTGEIPTEQIPVLQQTKKDELHIKGVASSYYYLFNNKQKPFSNKKIRRALSMAINRQLLIDKVTLSGELPAFGIVSPGIAGLNGEYRSEVKDNYFQENVEEAKKILQEGLQEEGLTTLEFDLAYNTNDKHKKIAQAIADMWSKNLNVKVKIQNQEWAVFLKNRTNLNYQVARAGWSTDYNDPMSFLDLYMTGGGNNDIGFSNPKYDELLKKAKTSMDAKERMDLMAQAEKILIEDEQAILPIYYYTSVGLTKPNVKGVFIDYQGMIHFDRGYLE